MLGAGFGYTVPHRFFEISFREIKADTTSAEIRAVGYAETLHGTRAKNYVLSCAREIEG
jgi:hypothetical protein